MPFLLEYFCYYRHDEPFSCHMPIYHNEPLTSSRPGLAMAASLGPLSWSPSWSFRCYQAYSVTSIPPFGGIDQTVSNLERADGYLNSLGPKAPSVGIPMQSFQPSLPSFSPPILRFFLHQQSFFLFRYSFQNDVVKQPVLAPIERHELPVHDEHMPHRHLVI